MDSSHLIALMVDQIFKLETKIINKQVKLYCLNPF